MLKSQLEKLHTVAEVTLSREPAGFGERVTLVTG
jgi:hypothetical protein